MDFNGLDLQEHKSIIKYVNTHMAEFPDAEEARNQAECVLRGIRPLLDKCETLADMKRLVEDKYSCVFKSLEKCRSEPPSIARLEKICKLAKDAINISCHDGDSSVYYSRCLSYAFDLLARRPKEAKGVEDEGFPKAEQERILKAVCGLGKVLSAFYKRYPPYSETVLLPGAGAFMSVEGSKLFSPNALNKGTFDYNPEFFGKYLRSFETCSDLLYSTERPGFSLGSSKLSEMFDKKLRSIKLSERFDEKYIEALYILLYPTLRGSVPGTKQHSNDCKVKYWQAVYKVNAWEILRRYDRACLTIEDLKKRKETPNSLNLAEKLADNDELYNAEQCVQEIRWKLRMVGLTLEDLRCQCDVVPVNANSQSVAGQPEQDSLSRQIGKGANGNGDNSTKRRLRGCSSFDDGEVTSIFSIAGNGTIITANGEDYKITRLRTWKIIDALLAAARDPNRDGWLKYSGRDLNCFRTRAKSGNTKKASEFKVKWIETRTRSGSGSKAIYEARLRTKIVRK